MESEPQNLRAAHFSAGLDVFFARLAAASQRVLLLDYDGTLAPFRIDPMQAEPYAGVRECLDEIMRDPASQVVIVSGRPARELWPLLRLKRPPAVWGSHGWEQLDPDGGYRCGPVDATPVRQFLQDETWIRAVENLGARYERKPGSLAVHWRGLASERIAEVRAVLVRHWGDAEARNGLVWNDFDGGVELRLPGRTKGYAIETVLNEYPQAPAAYLGDDLTDEDAFRAMRGRGVSILVRTELRATAADFWLRPPEELLDFLGRWQALGRGGQL